MGFFDNAWKAMDGLSQEAAKHIGPAAAEAWKHADAFGQEAGKHVGPAAHRTATWIKEHPGETAGIAACVVAAPVAIGVTGKVLQVAGFTRTGVLAGSAAAAYQSGVGSVAGGSAFAVLQSAGAGGAGATLVNGIAAGAATAIAVAASAPGLVKAAMEGNKEFKDEGEQCKDEKREEEGGQCEDDTGENEEHLIELQDNEEAVFAIGDKDEVAEVSHFEKN